VTFTQYLISMTAKIGITFDPPEKPMGMFNNGIRQNALYFTELLMNIGYDVRLIVEAKSAERTKGLYGFDTRYKHVNLENANEENFDIVIQLGYQIPKENILEFKKRGVKIVYYSCGSNYILDTESFLFGRDSGDTLFSRFAGLHPVFDQVWMIPQTAGPNKYYFETLYRAESVVVPFIWSPMAIEQLEKDCIASGMKTLHYEPKNDQKKIAIFEPNLNVVKWALPAVLVCENAYRANKNVGHVYVTNLPSNKEDDNRLVKHFTKLVKPLDLFIDKKISAESRYSTLVFMSKHADVAVSHQWENPLNYLYLDLAWMGWPIVHNAPMCKDVGYYYSGFDYAYGGKVLSDAIANHDGDKDYTERNRAAISRYLPTNKKSQEEYTRLINRLLKREV